MVSDMNYWIDLACGVATALSLVGGATISGIALYRLDKLSEDTTNKNKGQRYRGDNLEDLTKGITRLGNRRHYSAYKTNRSAFHPYSGI